MGARGSDSLSAASPSWAHILSPLPQWAIPSLHAVPSFRQPLLPDRLRNPSLISYHHEGLSPRFSPPARALNPLCSSASKSRQSKCRDGRHTTSTTRPSRRSSRLLPRTVRLQRRPRSVLQEMCVLRSTRLAAPGLTYHRRSPYRMKSPRCTLR